MRVPPPKKLAGPDGAEPTKAMVLTGVVKTSKGYAVATAVVDREGVAKLSLGTSQAYKEFVAREHKRLALAATLKA